LKKFGLKIRFIFVSCSFYICVKFILKVGKIVKNGSISTRSKLEDPMAKQLMNCLVWNLGNE